jgi:small subunit ribosomal protein S13
MARIAGVDIPREKHIRISLRYIYGIGPTRADQILEAVKFTPTTRVDQHHRRRAEPHPELIDREYRVEGDLRKEVNLNIQAAD